MQIPTFTEQTLTKLSLFGLEWDFGTKYDFSLVLSDVLSVWATIIFAITERVGATKEIFIIRATEEVVATIIFSFRGLTNRN
jgi:hypothetical protein